MPDVRYRQLNEIRKRAVLDPSDADNPIPFFKLALSRLLVGEPLDICEPRVRAFQESFPLTPMEFTNLRRRVCLGALQVLVGLPIGDSPREALAIAHRLWDTGKWANVENAIEACAAAALAGDEAELTLWRERAMTKAPIDWSFVFEESLFAFDPANAALEPESLATCVARVAIEGINGATEPAAPVVCALYHRLGSVASLAGRAAVVDEVVFGPNDEKVRVNIGRPKFELLDGERGPELAVTVKVTGRGPFSPGGYTIAPLTFELGDQLDRFAARISRLAEPERAQKSAAYDAALERADHGMSIRLQIGRGVELTPGDEAAFRARIEHAWEHVRRSFRAVHATARVEIIRA